MKRVTSFPTSLVSASAALWLARGQAFEAGGATQNLEAAVTAYDEALSLFCGMENPLTNEERRLLGVVWMNRGNALQKFGTPARLHAAVRDYDEAIVILGGLPCDADPAYRNHLGAAWLNRGHTLQRLITSTSLAEAQASFEQAIVCLSSLPLDEDAAYRRNLTGAWVNLATVHLDATPPRFPEAREAALTGLSLVQAHERVTADAADLALKARRALCAALGELLVSGHPALTESALASEASDAVDEALALVRAWEQRGVTAFRPLAVRFYRFGAQLYVAHQPQFLAEFLVENLDPSQTPGAMPDETELHVIARATIARVLAQDNRGQIFRLDAPANDRALRLRAELRQVEARLNDLAARHLSAPLAA